jgi:hypothetical protein
MGSLSMEIKYCCTCLERPAEISCDHCLRPLCKKCRSIEIWRTPDEEVVIRTYCPQCGDNPEVNPQGKGEQVFGLGQVTDMVNQGLGGFGRFKIKLKIT